MIQTVSVEPIQISRNLSFLTRNDGNSSGFRNVALQKTDTMEKMSKIMAVYSLVLCKNFFKAKNFKYFCNISLQLNKLLV